MRPARCSRERHREQTVKKTRTHYDNLMVARNAPPEVIRAAYKSLSQKYHPDRHGGDARAAQVMTIINSSYEVLSDPVRRRQHDEWIAQQESAGFNHSEKPTQPTQAARPANPNPNKPSRIGSFLGHIGRYPLQYFFVGLVAWLTFFYELSPPPKGPKPYSQTAPAPPLRASNPSQASITYVRPATAPNGRPWPTAASYIAGYPRSNTDGLSSVTVDNSRNDSDVFVKLVSLSTTEAYPVRQFYIPARGTFMAENVTAGTYDVRYRDLTTGGLSRSESFVLEETQVSGGIQYSQMSLTLYKVQNGNMQTYRLGEDEF